MELYWYRAVCIGVIDGDTIEVLIDLGFGMAFKERLRLHGVNTKEMRAKLDVERDEAVAAKDFVISTILNKEILINTIKDKKDKYGRYLAKVYIDSMCLNDELVVRGLAVPYMMCAT